MNESEPGYFRFSGKMAARRSVLWPHFCRMRFSLLQKRGWERGGGASSEKGGKGRGFFRKEKGAAGLVAHLLRTHLGAQLTVLDGQV
jgi:hypothetical protein